MIKDYRQLQYQQIFHFKNSLRPFLVAFKWEKNGEETPIFIDIDEARAFTLDELNIEWLDFYTNEDENFCGVEVEGKIEWVDDYTEVDDCDNDMGYDPYMGCYTDEC